MTVSAVRKLCLLLLLPLAYIGGGCHRDEATTPPAAAAIQQAPQPVRGLTIDQIRANKRNGG